MTVFATLLLRDMKLAAKSGGSAVLALSFFALVATLVPLGVGADLHLLARVAGGVLWVAAVLAALLSLDRLFQGDFEDGSLDMIALSPLPLELTALAKISAHWLSTGLPRQPNLFQQRAVGGFAVEMRKETQLLEHG